MQNRFDHQILDEDYFDKSILIFPIEEDIGRWSVVAISNPILLFKEDSDDTLCTVYVCNCQEDQDIVNNIINFLVHMRKNLMHANDVNAKAHHILKTENDQISAVDTGYLVLEYG